MGEYKDFDKYIITLKVLSNMTIMMNKRFFWAMATAFTRWDSSPTDLIKVYKGTIPADADLYDPASPTYTVDELVTFGTWTLSTPVPSSTDNAHPDWGKVEFTPTTGFPNPATVNATGTGTAAWYAIYNSTSSTRYAVGDVSLSGGTGTLTLDSLSLVSGNPVTIINWGVHFKS